MVRQNKAKNGFAVACCICIATGFEQCRCGSFIYAVHLQSRLLTSGDHQRMHQRMHLKDRDAAHLW
eukprot:1153119-Pelagomonas_calceolata.AAC.1